MNADYSAKPLSGGKGTPDAPCLMSKASLVHAQQHGYLTPDLVNNVFTDNPCWADPIVRPIVIFVNDALPDGSDQFDRLDKLLPRIMNATKISDPDVEKRVHARVLCQQARKVLHLVDERYRRVCEISIATREAWLNGDATEGDCCQAAEAARAARAAEAAGAAWAAEAAEAARAAWAARAAEAAGAAWAACAAEAAWTAWAARAARAAWTAWAEEHAVDWLDEFLDALEKARAEEGVMLDDGWIAALAESGFVVDVTV